MTMMKFVITLLFVSIVCIGYSQSIYSGLGGVESTYKDKYTFKATLDEKKQILSFETNAPVTVSTLEIYTPSELAVRKGKEFTNTYSKKGNLYYYDLKKAALKNKYAYWLKVSWGPNGAPLGEWFFKKKIKPENEPTETAEEKTAYQQETDPTKPTIKTNIKCEAGKTKVTNALKALDGVFEVNVDIKTGILKLHYSSDGTSLKDIVDEILKNGFDANGKKTTKLTANPCLTKKAK